MKKFHFSLDTVLSYKQQRLELLQSEHSILMGRVRTAEQYLARLRQQYRDEMQAYQEDTLVGMSITEARLRQSGFRALERDIQAAEQALEECRAEAEEKRLEVVSAKQETTSIEKLEQKKKEAYRKAVTKDSEIFIDEFVSAAQAVKERA